MALPAYTLAQGYSQAPMVVIGGQEPEAVAPNTPITANFPDEAVTRVGENSTGQIHGDAPAAPASPAPAASAQSPAATSAPADPSSPSAPDSPSNRLWPRNTASIFIRSCAGFHVEYIPSCSCIISALMVEMPHDEFMEKSENNTIEQDPRLIAIRNRCVATPQRKD